MSFLINLYSKLLIYKTHITNNTQVRWFFVNCKKQIGEFFIKSLFIISRVAHLFWVAPFVVATNIIENPYESHEGKKISFIKETNHFFYLH
jgi:hypothetical protein